MARLIALEYRVRTSAGQRGRFRVPGDVIRRGTRMSFILFGPVEGKLMAEDARVQQVEALLRMIDEAYDRRAWHGPNLRAAIRGVTASQAAWRPGAGRHNIRELVVHA